MPLPVPQTLQDKRMSELLSGVVSGEEYDRRVRLHLANGGSPDLYSCRPNHLHSVLGLACHRGRLDLVMELLAAGAQAHWPEDRVSRRKWGEGGQSYDGVLLDPLGVCLDMLDAYCREEVPGEGWVPDKTQARLDEYVAIAKALIAAGADPLRKDPAYRVPPMDRLQPCLERDDLPPAVVEVFLDLMLHVAQSVPFPAMEHMARGQWKKLKFISAKWTGEQPVVAAKLAALAQARCLSEQSPAAGATRHCRL